MKQTFLLLAVACAALAAAVENGPVRNPESEPSIEEIQTIRKILELPPERLSRIRVALERLERMPPESRREFANNLSKYENATPEERRKLAKEMRERGGFNGRLLEHYLKPLPPEDVRAERERIIGLTPEKRQEFLRQLGEKYGPEIARERAEKGKLMDKKDDGKDGDRPMMKRRRPEDGTTQPPVKPVVPAGEG